jgi:Cft2 family RNA processing exonuclease
MVEGHRKEQTVPESYDEALDRVFEQVAAEPLPEPSAKQLAASRARAERLRRIQARAHQVMLERHGGELTSDQVTTLTRRVVKGK